MLDNHSYNLMSQLVEEHKSLWRIKNKYKNDAGDCGDCNKFWNAMIEDKEEHIKDLLGMIKTHLG